MKRDAASVSGLSRIEIHVESIASVKSSRTANPISASVINNTGLRIWDAVVDRGTLGPREAVDQCRRSA